MDANILIRQEEFFYADCIAIDPLKVIGYKVIK